MKTKNERVFYHPYEYKLFEAHFQNMALQGWKLLDIIDHNYFLTLQYEKCEPHTRYYYTDFCNDLTYFLFSEGSKESMDYKAFIESYGYEFVAGKRGLMVYTSETPIAMELREESLETRKQLRRASYKSLLFPAFMFFASFFISVSSILDIFTNFSLFVVRDNFTFARIVTYGAMSVLFGSMLFPVLWWRLTGRMSHSFHHMRIRFYMNIICVFFWVSSYLLISYTKIVTILLLCFVLPLSLLMVLWDHLRDKRIRNIITFICLCGIALWMFVLMNTTIMDKQDHKDVNASTFTSEQFGLPNLETEVNKEESYVLLSEDTMFYIKGTRNEPEAEYQNVEIESYQIYYVKDTLLHDYIVAHAPYEHDQKPVKSRVKDYAVYTLEDRILVQKGSLFIKFDRNLYDRITPEQLDVLYAKAYDQYVA